MEYLFFGGLIFLVFVIYMKMAMSEQNKLAEMSDVERENYNFDKIYGNVNQAMVCPHCNEKGKIRTMPVVHKKGISGGKATAALFTGGVSMLATGLSRKESSTQAHCANCNNIWQF